MSSFRIQLAAQLECEPEQLAELTCLTDAQLDTLCEAMARRAEAASEGSETVSRARLAELMQALRQKTD